MKKMNKMLCVMASALLGIVSNTGVSAPARNVLQDQSLLLVGPVESIDWQNQTLVVLGQQLHTALPRFIEVGTTVRVYGVVDNSGRLIVSRLLAGPLYVPGATPILLTGVVQEIDQLTWQAVVNGVRVDLASLAYSTTETPAVGSLVRLFGTQPVGKGVLLVNGIQGGAINGIQGGAINGIQGGAINGIQGGAINGIQGGAINGIQGGAINGIQGGAINGIQGGAVY